MNAENNKISNNFIKIWLPLLILATGFTALYHHVIVKLVSDWINDDNYSHGFLIPFIAGYMVWKKKEILSQYEPVTNKWGLALIVLGICMCVAGNIGAELFTTRFSIVILITGIVLYLFGTATFKEVYVPVLYLIFMIPIPAIIWNKLAFPLQLLSAAMTEKVIHLINIPIFRQGNILHLANTSLEVVDACSGLRSLTTLLALSAAFAYMSKLKLINKWLVFLSAIPIAVFVNILRLTATAIMAQFIGEDAAQGFLHEMSGIVVFIVAFFMLLGSSALFSKIEASLSS